MRCFLWCWLQQRLENILLRTVLSKSARSLSVHHNDIISKLAVRLKSSLDILSQHTHTWGKFRHWFFKLNRKSSVFLKSAQRLLYAGHICLRDLWTGLDFRFNHPPSNKGLFIRWKFSPMHSWRTPYCDAASQMNNFLYCIILHPLQDITHAVVRWI